LLFQEIGNKEKKGGSAGQKSFDLLVKDFVLRATYPGLIGTPGIEAKTLGKKGEDLPSMGATCVYAVEPYAKTPQFCTEPVEVKWKGMHVVVVVVVPPNRTHSHNIIATSTKQP
jgi:hypothetical protein